METAEKVIDEVLKDPMWQKGTIEMGKMPFKNTVVRPKVQKKSHLSAKRNITQDVPEKVAFLFWLRFYPLFFFFFNFFFFFLI